MAERLTSSRWSMILRNMKLRRPKYLSGEVESTNRPAAGTDYPDSVGGAGRQVSTRLGELYVHSRGTGPTVVLWHSVDFTSWARLADRLTATRRLVMIDGPGHGNSTPTPRPFTLDACAGAAADALDQLDLDEPVDWLGNAWGGHVGIAFAASRPDRCRTLVTVGTPTHALRADERRRNGLLVRLYGLVGPIRPLQRAVADALLSADTRQCDPAAVQLVQEAFRRPNRRGMKVAMQSAMLHRPDLTATLPNVMAPTLFVVATRDPLWTTTDAHAASAHLPADATIEIDTDGHLGPILLAAPATADLLHSFWNDPTQLIGQ